jgi:hypothetical protein
MSGSVGKQIRIGAFIGITMFLAVLLPRCILFPDEGFQGELLENVRPSVTITGGVYQDNEDTENRVRFFWSGSDTDGVIRYFEWAIDDTVSEQAWRQTTDNDANISFAAVSPVIVYPDPTDEEPNPGPDPATEYTDWHSFYVRSVDNNFVRSKPDKRFFNAHTIAPVTRLTQPQTTNTTLATTVQMGWEGEDLDGIRADKLPAYFEVKLIHPGSLDITDQNRVLAVFADSANLLLGNLSPLDYPVGSDIYQQAKRAWVRLDGETNTQWLRSMDPGAGKYAFGVRAIDEAGAVEQTFVNGLNWRRFSVGPSPVDIRMRESSFGEFNFSATAWGDVWEVTAAPGQRINFTWTGDASSAGTQAGACNYGFDIPDPEDDNYRAIDGMGGWIGWAPRTRLQTPISFPAATGDDQVHFFYLKMRDLSDNPESETKCIVRIEIAEFSFANKFLIVDDLRNGPYPCSGSNPADELSDTWRLQVDDGVYHGVLSQVGAYLSEAESPGYFWTFGESREPNTVNIPDDFLSFIGQYQTIIWDYGNGQDRDRVGLAFATDQERSIPQYIALGGNLLLYGSFGPVSSIVEVGEGQDEPECPQAGTPLYPWNDSSFLWQQLHLHGCIRKAGHQTHPARSLIGVEAVNPLYPDLTLDPSRWVCGSTYKGMHRYEVLAPEFAESEAIPWYDLEEGLEILYRSKTLSSGVAADHKPIVYRTSMTAEDSLLGQERGRVVCFGFHPYWMYEEDVRDAFSLAIDWLVTGSEYSGIEN